jgi:ketosteroid isomerase-like protein
MKAGHQDSRAEQIRAYFEACNRGTADEIAAHFTDDAVIYDTNHNPVRTAEGIGRFWLRIRDQWAGATWGVDRVVSDGETAAIEWHMAGRGEHGRFVFRGSEHYAFDGDLIAEIRQYWNFDPDRLDTGLIGYPYAEVT